MLVVGLLLLGGCGGSDGNSSGQPGRIVTDPRGFRYVVWPFTFNGLTVGRPLDKLDLIGALGYEDSVKAKARAYLEKRGLTEADLAVHQGQVLWWTPRFLDSRKLGPDKTRKYLGQFLAFFKIKNLDYQRLRARFVILAGTIISLKIQGGERPAPLAPDAGVDKFTAALGKPDLVLEVMVPGKIAPNLSSEVKWYVWRNLICWVHQGRVVRVDIHSGPHLGQVGPRPRDENHFSCGWIMPWKLIQRLAKRPDVYRLLRLAAEAKGVAWRPENDFLLSAIYSTMVLTTFTYSAWYLKTTFPGYMGKLGHEACYRGLAPLLPYLFPGLKIDPKKFKIDSCSALFFGPAIINRVNISFERPGWLTRAEFERVFGSPDKVRTGKYKGRVGHDLFYLAKHIIAFFLKGRLMRVTFNSLPVVYPPPRDSQ